MGQLLKHDVAVGREKSSKTKMNMARAKKLLRKIKMVGFAHPA